MDCPSKPHKLSSQIFDQFEPEKPHTSIHVILWPKKDSILTGGNPISVQERREAKQWPVFVTPAQMANHMTSGREVCSIYACAWEGRRGQYVTRTMDDTTFNSLFSRLPFQQNRAGNSQNRSLFLCLVGTCYCLKSEPHICLVSVNKEAQFFSLAPMVTDDSGLLCQNVFFSQMSVFFTSLHKYLILSNPKKGQFCLCSCNSLSCIQVML